ncbi:MAG: GNAT family N-acetyltransferase [Ilumatobacteraceae bacterium]
MNEHIRVRRAHHDDLRAIGTTLARSFQDDPVFTWCVPDAEHRRTVLPAFFGSVAEGLLSADEVFVAGVTARPVTPAVDGAALWIPPSAETGGALDLEQLFGNDVERVGELVAMMEEHHPTVPHHYLWFLGVDPAAQGRGIGSTLLEAAAPGPAYLEATSKDNRRLYERHGFEVVDELAVGSSPPLWAMWRP